MNEKPRILQVIDHTGAGGAQVVVGAILEALSGDFHFLVANLGRRGRFSDEYRSHGATVFELSGRLGRYSPLPAITLARLVSRERVGVVHAHLERSSLLAAAAAALIRTPLIIHDHTGYYPSSLKHHYPRTFVRLFLTAYRLALSRAVKVLVLTEREREQYRKAYPRADGRIICMPNTVNVEKFTEASAQRVNPPLREELALAPDRKLVIFVGRLAPVKDPMTFLKVAQLISERMPEPPDFLLVGNGPDERALKAFADEHGIRGVHFLGYREDIPSLLRQADVMILPSRREPFGIVMLEAMAAGCPVVATRSGGPESIISHGDDGLLADVGDDHGLAEGVERLLTDDELRARITRNALQKVKSNHDVKIYMDELRRVYLEVIGDAK